ncbi:MAG: ABC transporter substrate-binding protein [Propionicimonas sp.]|uniref:ABC transporter substrate-binding protein n=1 Tax=Propionicimonas sp. TaxID=1955623 RepID=UPI002B20DEFB|nr:ABC transporter substrate-binding protein [Propionicimonas sp.]MEA4944678.1 ABC transporter substrate-binding protein [Propionicimonas sp.]MEA5052713.1 ABC transporter substrate-binding protein [Propionicimonas sp.]MEA5116632.1 ABC transporter substrate-binding protein [Propionicimonas sp.]
MRITRWARVVAVGALALGLVACAGQGTPQQSGSTEPTGGTSAQPQPSSSGPITLQFWHGMTGPDGPAVQQVIDDFNASQSEIVIKPNIMPWDQLYQKLLTSVTSADGPQIIAMDASRVPQYAGTGALATTDDFFADTTYVDTSVLPAAAVNASKFKGTNYGIPFNLAPMMLYYNKDLFSAAGLDPEKPPTTWDEFTQMAAKLTVDQNGDGKPEQYAIALADHETVPMYQPFMWNNGGGVVSEDGTTSIVAEPASLEALDFWVKQVRDNKVSPIGLAGADADKLFQTGKAAMEIVGPWMTNGFTEAGINFGLARPFAGPTGQDTLMNVVTFTLNAKITDEQRKAAYTFFSYWNSVDSQVTWADGSGFPPSRTDIPADKLKNQYSATFGQKELLDNSRVLLAGVPNAGTITDEIFYPALQKVLNGKGSVEEVFQAASKDIQAQIDKG